MGALGGRTKLYSFSILESIVRYWYGVRTIENQSRIRKDRWQLGHGCHSARVTGARLSKVWVCHVLKRMRQIFSRTLRVNNHKRQQSFSRSSFVHCLSHLLYGTSTCLLNTIPVDVEGYSTGFQRVSLLLGWPLWSHWGVI